MGCGMYKSPKDFFVKKSDLIELQKYPDELHERRIKILKWMENNIDIQTKISHMNIRVERKGIKNNEQLAYWQEAWQREQELVKHPSIINSCQSKMPCITLIDENVQLVCTEDVDRFWNESLKSDDP